MDTYWIIPLYKSNLGQIPRLMKPQISISGFLEPASTYIMTMVKNGHIETQEVSLTTENQSFVWTFKSYQYIFRLKDRATATYTMIKSSHAGGSGEIEVRLFIEGNKLTWKNHQGDEYKFEPQKT